MRRTREKIFRAVETLVARQCEDISVTDIVHEARVSKTSFYTHFASLDELAVQIVGDAYEHLGPDAEVSVERDSFENVRMRYRALVEHYVQLRPFYVAVVALHLSRAVHTNVVRAMAADIEPLITAHPGLPAGLRPELAASFIASAVVGFLDEWIEDDFEATPEELLEHLMALLPQWYTGVRDLTA
ncbi:TetR/AcrR family transcriptional regulator [Citricoccus parietis]|uniref:TetR/AcrR family transcriptional regulator n=1 Tax=Citricoccus parietis TaxID=592307 RepID=UPI00366BCC47